MDVCRRHICSQSAAGTAIQRKKEKATRMRNVSNNQIYEESCKIIQIEHKGV
jgi:hypothetical protein